MENSELIFIPSAGLSHIVSTVETAKLLLRRDDRLSITVLTMKLPNDTTVDNYTTKISAAADTPSRLKFAALPPLPHLSPASKTFYIDFINGQIPNAREIISGMIRRPETRVVGICLDMFCMNFQELATEFGIPSYSFFTSSACTLGLFQYLVSLRFEENKDLKEFKNSNAELPVPVFKLPVPAKVLPPTFFDSGPVPDIFLNSFKKIRETKGVVVNTFYELEPYAIDSLLSDDKIPKIYPVGPVLSAGGGGSDTSNDNVIKWLDGQEENSVIFLCFGTMGSFGEAQVKEIADALENSGCRFLWSLRKPGPKGARQRAGEYDDFQEVLPEGFLVRTAGVGKVIGWAPQAAVLAHTAVGGFVSHCGWSSILESVRFGVPIATFPLYAEQQINSFYLVKEMGMAEMIRLDYSLDFKEERPQEIVGAAEIEAGIRRLMAAEEVKGKVKEMQRKAREALEEGGSSYKAQSLFIEDVIRNVG